MANVANNSGEFEGEESKGSSKNPCSPQTPMMLWIIVFIVVVIMVVWSIRKFGTRSSAEPKQETPPGMKL